MATIREITSGFPKKYICVRNTNLDAEGLIVSAEIVKVYDTLEAAKENSSEIYRMLKKYPDFDIVYGDYENYINTRRNNPIVRTNIVHNYGDEKLTQSIIDNLIANLRK